MHVYLLTVEPGRRVFYSDPAGPEEADQAPRSVGLRGWAEARLLRLKAGLHESRAGALRASRAVWNWLHHRTHPDEPLLARLRRARTLHVHHPASMPEDEAGAAWRAFLAAGLRRHWPRLVVNVLIAPLTIVLAPLPGPNVIGYWFAYRAVHHGLILVGLRRARSGRVATRFLAAEALDRPVGPGDDPAEAALRLTPLGCDTAALARFLARQKEFTAEGAERKPEGENPLR